VKVTELAENAAIKLARSDVRWAKEHNRNIFVQGKGEDVFLTSGSMLPFNEESFVHQIENAAEFQSYFTSGSILHHFVESKISPKQLARYIDGIFEKPINYVTLTPTLSTCMSCYKNLIAQDGKDVKVCPSCGSDDIATFSRVIGYVKMISRKNINVNEDGKYEGDYNFWSNARRIDWNERRRFGFDDATGLKVVENPNTKVVEAIRKRLEITDGQCPCIPEDKWNEDTMCPCKDFREQEEEGFCHCQLYKKERE
jgi:predicted RNA-binding Zn-ribbon protein involved in translation (DUF1610 family)